MVQGSLFAHTRVRAARPLKPSEVVLAEWQEIWALQYGRALTFDTYAARIETMRHCKRLAEAVDDGELRRQVLALYVRTDSTFLRDREHALRYVLVGWQLKALLAEARRVLADRPRTAAKTATASGAPARWSVVDRLNGNGNGGDHGR